MPNIRFLEPASHGGAQLPLLPVRVLGIDLGTTNSTVAEAVWDPSGNAAPLARCIDVEQESVGESVRSPLVPSVVAIVNGRTVVGHGASQFRRAPAEFNLEENATLFYEAKNFIGLSKTYPKAPEGFRSPAEIGGHVLRALHSEATAAGAADRVVVTVPASFQTNQRAETVHAAALAGIDVASGDLLDEPVAAFVDWFVAKDGEPFVRRGPGTLLVFDFGGGTCDVAVFHVDASAGARPEISPLAVSRYHRLGGGDIDRAIVYEALVPQLLEQNHLGRFDLGFDAKRNFVEPALLATAEALKIDLCSNPSAESATVRRSVKIRLEDRELRLVDPTLSRERFKALLEPFVDPYCLFASESEYRSELSIFVPLEDALERAGLDADEVDYVLLTGGSTLIPEIVRAVEQKFGDADVLAYPTLDSVQTAVARGAAYHAMSLALFGEGIVKPVAHDAISLRTAAGPVEIVPKGVELPYPLDARHAVCRELAVPESSDGSLELRIEVVAGSDMRLLGTRLWEISAAVEKGDPLRVDVSLDENQVLNLSLQLERDGAWPFAMRIENPITHVVNPGEVRVRIEETERDLEMGVVPPMQIVTALTSLGSDYAEIGHRERGLDRLQRALKRLGRPDARILHQMGMIAGELGDAHGQQKYYLQAAAADVIWSSPLFNLALAQFQRDEVDEARRNVDLAIERYPAAPYYVLKAKIARGGGDDAVGDRALARAFEEFAPLASLDAWEMHWYEAAAKLNADEPLLARIHAEKRSRAGAAKVERVERGLLPDRLGATGG
jgi:molecular chaperone DnaK (HSP70)